MPEGAVELARNESGVQSFRTGRGLAVQFHPEMSGDLLASWCREEGGAEELIAAGRDPDELIEESRYREVESQPGLERMLDWFLDEVAGADQTSLGERVDQVGHDVLEGEIQLEEIEGWVGLTPLPPQALEESHSRLLDSTHRR